MFISVPLADRFWSKVDTQYGADACWLWTAAKHPRGYGAIFVGKRRLMAHRVAWEITHGPIPEGLHVLHKCDTPLCVRPSHLWLGTHIDNMRDRDAKGRNVNKRGSQHARSKLTEAQVRAIRSSRLTRRELAERYGVCLGNIDSILKRKTWTHV